MKKGRISAAILLGSPFLWLIVFMVIPLGLIGVLAVTTKGPYGTILWQLTGDNFRRVFEGIYLGILGHTLWFASLTTLICLAIGYPFAFILATAPKRWRPLLMTAVMLPFLTNFVIRVYAIRALLGHEGPISNLLLWLGLSTQSISLNNTVGAVWFGMVTNYLPFMVLPLMVTFDKFNFTLIEAARDLGAGSWVILRKIVIPLTGPGIASGCSLVFLPALGEFVIPDLLGGAQSMLMGNLITDQFLKVRHWPFGAALASVLLLTIMVLLSGIRRMRRFD